MTRAPRHRPQDPLSGLKDWHCWLILTLLAGFFFREILLGTAYFWEDFLYQNYPFRNFAATSLAMGQWPLWNPYTFSGMPFLADIQTTVLYLPSLFLTLLVHGGRLNFYWLEVMIVLHYPLAGIGMFALARSFGIRRLPALFSGLAFMLSGFMIAHAIHQQIITLSAWYPLVFLLFRQVLREHRWVPVFLTALVLGHSTLAGYPQLSLYLYLFLGCVLIFELLATYPGKALLSGAAWHTLGRAATTFLLSLAVASIQLLPTLELSPLSQRAEITYAKAATGSLSWEGLLTFVYPKFFGVSSAAGSTYWGPGEYWYYWETCVYLGIPALLLTLLSLAWIRRNRNIAFFWGVITFVLLYSLGDHFPLHALFYHAVPGFSLFRNPARMAVLIALLAPLLAGFSFDALLFEELPVRRRRISRLILLGVAGLGMLLWLLQATGAFDSLFPPLQNPRIASVTSGTMFPGVLFLLLSTALLLSLLREHGTHLLPGVALPLLLFIDLSWFGGSQPLSSLNPADYFAQTRRLVEFLKSEGEKEIFRVNTRVSAGMILDRNQGMIDRIFMMEGYTPLALQRMIPPTHTAEQALDLLNVKYKTVIQEGNRLALAPNPGYLPRAFFLYHLVVTEGEEALIRYMKSPEFDPRTTAVLEHDPGLRLTPPEDPPVWKASITSYENNAILLDAETDHDGLLALSEIFYPGWKATVDGATTSLYCIDYSLRGLFVQKGHHTVLLRFQPDSFLRGAGGTLLALAICCVGTVLSLRRHRDGRPP